MSSITLTKKVNYSPNQRLDLTDKQDEAKLIDDTTQQYRQALLMEEDDGRVLRGWRTTTVPGANAGFTIAGSEESVAVDRAGNVLLLDGSVALTVTLQQNAINYVHAYYIEQETDPASRRFFQSGAEISQTVNTRITRGANLFRSNTAIGSPAWAGFQTSTVISGVTYQLIPLYAVVVDNSNSITSVTDYRPMFAPGATATVSNQYAAASGNPDFPFNFVPATNHATLGIQSVRDGLVALADRVLQIKGSTNWYDDAQNQFTFTSGNGGKLASSWKLMELGAPNLRWGYASAYAPDGVLSTTGSFIQTLTDDGLHLFLGTRTGGQSSYNGSINSEGIFFCATNYGAIAVAQAPLHIIGSSFSSAPYGTATHGGVAIFEQTSGVKGPGPSTSARNIIARMALGPFNPSASSLGTSSTKIVEYAMFDYRDDFVSAGAGACGGIGALQGYLQGTTSIHNSVIRLWDYSSQVVAWQWNGSNQTMFIGGTNLTVPDIAMNSAKVIGVDHTRFFVNSGSPTVDTSNGNALTIPVGASAVIPIHLPGSIGAITSITTGGVANGATYQTVLYKVNGTTGVSTNLAFSTSSSHTQGLIYASNFFTDTLSGTFPIVSPDESLYLQINATGGVSTAIKYITANVASISGMGSPRL